jgi:hypothetical protein
MAHFVRGELEPWRWQVHAFQAAGVPAEQVSMRMQPTLLSHQQHPKPCCLVADEPPEAVVLSMLARSGVPCMLVPADSNMDTGCCRKKRWRPTWRRCRASLAT